MAITNHDLEALDALIASYRHAPNPVNATISQAHILRSKLEKTLANQRLKYARDDDEWAEANAGRADERRRINGRLTPAQQRAIEVAPYIEEGRD